MNIKTRSDYTFKYNSKLGRHGWLRLTPAYSVKLVKELIEKNLNHEKNNFILDPFSGTATTGLVAAELGLNAHLFDINPFLIWFGNIKCQSFSLHDIYNVKHEVSKILSTFKDLTNQDNWKPDIFNIERWWNINTLESISALRAAIVIHCDIPKNLLPENPYNLIWVAFMRLIIETSSAAFNHVSMSFQEKVNEFDVIKIEELFMLILNNILDSSITSFCGKSQVFNCDSKQIQSQLNVKYDNIITSPPYPNRMTYIRELRPYMYWSGFLTDAKEAGELDWIAIGGTWGSATSKLKFWNDKLPISEELNNIVLTILNSNDKNSELMANYVHKYFFDMYNHFSTIRPLLKNGATINYIIGNSSFYNNLVNTEIIIEDCLNDLGFKNIKSEIIRKRNCNKNLFEFNISAIWNG